MDCGIAEPRQHGPVVTPWSEIRAWQLATGNHGWWLASAVKALSSAYVDEFYAAKSPTRPNPLWKIKDDYDRDKEASRQFHQFIKAKG